VRLEDWRRDAAFAARMLARSPGFTAAAVVALALAIGANTTVFTLANAFLFKNLPFDAADRIVYISSHNPRSPTARTVSYPDYLALRTQVPSLAGIGGLTTSTVDLSDGVALPEPYRCASISAGAFAILGQRPVLGREFGPEDELPGRQRVAVLGNAVWRARYGGDPAIVGRTVRLNDLDTTIVGVMPPRLTFPGTSDLWLPLIRTPAMERRTTRTVTVFGRLADGASLRMVNAELGVVASRLATSFPASNADTGFVAETFNDRYNSGQTGRLLYWLLWAVVFVLLIACANVANLLLARGAVRAREMSIRASLGATRWQIVRQLLIESLLVALLAGVGGALLGVWGVKLFDAALVPAVKPAYIDFSIDARVVLYLAGVTTGAAVLFGLVPAIQMSKLDLATALKDGTAAAGTGRRARAVSAALVVIEVALAVVLLTGAGLMARSFVNTTRATIGIDPGNLLSFSVNLRRTRYPSVGEHVQFYERLKSRITAIPGVEGLSVASDLPAESPDEFEYEVEGAPVGGQSPRAMGLLVDEDYFRVLGIRTRRGREFQVSDTPASPPVAIVNEALARRAWPQGDAVGRRVKLTARDGDRLEADTWLTIAGVVPDILQDDESFDLSPVIYLPYRQRPEGGMELLVRARVPPASLAESIRGEVRGLDGDLAVRGLRPMEDSLWLRNWRHRVFGAMFSIFGVIGLVLASLGLYAVMAHAVSQRTREFGVRRTLGASTATIAWIVIRQAALRFAVGLTAGLAGAAAVTRVLDSMLVGVEPIDPLTFLIVTVVLGAAVTLGCAIPAHRATRVDPLVALRWE
jgi:predicted permease